MDSSSGQALHASSSAEGEAFFETGEGSRKEESSDDQVHRQEGGSGPDLDHAKRSKGPSGGHNASSAKNKALENLEDCVKGLMITQMRESPKDGEIMCLLRRCLASSPKGASFVVVSNNTEHYECKQALDMGWGCGWRNIQMLASYLIAEDAEVRETLFGGVGFVPDIPALQQWLEIAWAKGFDVPGGEFFDWKVKGTNKWIGTTEGAALLRSFGVRARIADFQATGGKREPPTELRSKTGTEGGHPQKGGDGDGDRSEAGEGYSSGSASHGSSDRAEASEPRRTATDTGALVRQCIVCGERKLQDVECHDWGDADMCPLCTSRLKDSGNTDKDDYHSTEEEETQITGRQRHGWDDKTGGGCKDTGQSTVKHQQLVEWVWKYFTASTTESKLSSSLRLSLRSPLYFQHRGHSQTIVGIERRKVSTSPDSEEVNLLVLDPSEKTADIVESLRNAHGWEPLVKRGLQTLRQTEYQLCYAERGVAKGQELENLKILTSRSYTY